ncbi:hypothetical protein [Streptomyces sp. NEAU-S77]|uniref:hypothetical protein n=1 Tax=Streptomyces sp. NEAU-S77 TaxID=3411033 RepID=UPI003B9EF5C2
MPEADLRDYATAPDFVPAPADDVDLDGKPIPRALSLAESRLAYVAVTRARHQLAPYGLSWTNDHPDGCPGHPSYEQSPPQDPGGTQRTFALGPAGTTPA